MYYITQVFVKFDPVREQVLSIMEDDFFQTFIVSVHVYLHL